jgi:hypothetical protein
VDGLDGLTVRREQFGTLVFRDFPDIQAPKENVFDLKVFKSLFISGLGQHPVNDATVLDPENFHIGVSYGFFQPFTEIRQDLVPFVNYFEPCPGTPGGQLEDPARDTVPVTSDLLKLLEDRHGDKANSSIPSLKFRHADAFLLPGLTETQRKG